MEVQRLFTIKIQLRSLKKPLVTSKKPPFYQLNHILMPTYYRVETVQDFLIELDIKPHLHLMEISNFSLNKSLSDLPKS